MSEVVRPWTARVNRALHLTYLRDRDVTLEDLEVRSGDLAVRHDARVIALRWVLVVVLLLLALACAATAVTAVTVMETGHGDLGRLLAVSGVGLLAGLVTAVVLWFEAREASAVYVSSFDVKWFVLPRLAYVDSDALVTHLLTEHPDEMRLVLPHVHLRTPADLLPADVVAARDVLTRSARPVAERLIAADRAEEARRRDQRRRKAASR